MILSLLRRENQSTNFYESQYRVSTRRYDLCVHVRRETEMVRHPVSRRQL
jgi:hypothetical protein